MRTRGIKRFRREVAETARGARPSRLAPRASRPKNVIPVLRRRLKYLCAHAQTQMTKTISLSDEAYAVLRRHKLATESFSDTVVRLARHGGKVSEVIGLIPELRGKTGLERVVRENRRRIDARVGSA